MNHLFFFAQKNEKSGKFALNIQQKNFFEQQFVVYF